MWTSKSVDRSDPSPLVVNEKLSVHSDRRHIRHPTVKANHRVCDQRMRHHTNALASTDVWAAIHRYAHPGRAAGEHVDGERVCGVGTEHHAIDAAVEDEVVGLAPRRTNSIDRVVQRQGDLVCPRDRNAIIVHHSALVLQL